MTQLKIDPFNNKPKKKNNLVFKVVGGLFVTSLMAGSGYFYWQYREAVNSNPIYETEQVTAAVRRLMDLPQDSLPTLATVTEKEKLQGQDFFKNAENGDKVLIYVDEGKAILYRPSINKIIDIAPIQPTEPAVAGAADQIPVGSVESEIMPENISISFLNGTNITGITRTVEKQLTTLSYDFTVGKRENAKKSNYQETIIVDLTGGALKSQAAELAKILSARVDELPEGETDPETNGLLVIVGSSSAPATASTASPTTSDTTSPQE